MRSRGLRQASAPRTRQAIETHWRGPARDVRGQKGVAGLAHERNALSNVATCQAIEGRGKGRMGGRPGREAAGRAAGEDQCIGDDHLFFGGRSQPRQRTPNVSDPGPHQARGYAGDAPDAGPAAWRRPAARRRPTPRGDRPACAAALPPRRAAACGAARPGDCSVSPAATRWPERSRRQVRFQVRRLLGGGAWGCRCAPEGGVVCGQVMCPAGRVSVGARGS